ncbi:MAG: serine--tRNA ligase [Legionellales bacterium]|jgi:seryl-tRNA synthetase|nr:serine--tRNA ligase [Legionellales bacterium]
MLDTQLLKSNLDEIANKLLKKNFILDSSSYMELENSRKQLQSETEELQQQRNEKSKSVGILKSQKGDATQLLDELNKISAKLKTKELQLTELKNKIKDFLLLIPNIPHETVPAGTDENDNVVVSTWGQVPDFKHPILDHTDIGERLGLMDFERSAKLSGSRFVVLSKGLAKLQRALIQFMLDTHVDEHGYNEVYVPFMVKEECLYGTGALPKMREDLFEIAGEDHDLFLIPTAEVPVTNLHRNEIIDIKTLPLKYVAHTPCFRSEAGSYGKDTKGLIRQHQFEKVELVQFVSASESWNTLEAICNDAQNILKKLNLPYRVVSLCGGDLSFSSAKTYDIEVWLPSQNCYREISSCSNFGDFQARRVMARTRKSQQHKPELLHTLNGSGLAVGRTLVAIMENYQQQDGSIKVPEALSVYMNGITIINK